MKINKSFFPLKATFIGILLFQLHIGFSQEAKSSALYKTIMSKDSLLFNVGFNTCDIRQFEDLYTDDFEFYHDKDSISDKTQFLNNLKRGICAKDRKYHYRRTLLDESTAIYPLYKNGTLYGAVQIGAHRFFENTAGKQEQPGSFAKFTHLWLLKNKVWKLARSLSYDHQMINPTITKPNLFDNDELTENWLKENKIPTLGIGLISEGQLKQIKVFGELKLGVAAPYNTIWNVASLTKPITAIVALKLVSSGKWYLDEPLYKYWTDPEIALDPKTKLLTTRIILSHQSGFPNWRFLNKSGKLDFKFTPGTQYQYSGEGFEYLRKALEKKFHKTLDQLADELIFKPLKMNDTRFTWDDKADHSRYAIGYDNNGKPYEPTKNKTVNAADDLLTTIEDYGNFLCSVLNAEGLSSKLFTDMTSHQVETKKNKYFGLGFEIYDLGNDQYALSHGGADKGVHTMAILLPKTKQGLLIFTNVDDGYKVYEKIISHYLGQTGQKIVAIETQ